MTWALGAGLLAALVLWILQNRPWRRAKAPRIAYQRRDFLLTPEERQLFAALKDAVGEHYELFAKLRLADVVAPRGGGPLPESLLALRLSFLLCHRRDLTVACGVQLAPLQAGSRDAAGEGDSLRGICQAAGLPLVEIAASPLYDRQEIQAAVAAALTREPLYATEANGRKEPGFSGLEDLDL
jgi:hypothetical protein